MNSLCINSHELGVKEYNQQRVVSFRDIDIVHERPKGTASRNFRKNKERFILDEDYYKITPDEFRRTLGYMDKRQRNDITLLTETGYLMLVKSFTDDLAWNVQRELVKRYFRPEPMTAEKFNVDSVPPISNLSEANLLFALARRIDSKYWRQYLYRYIAQEICGITERDIYPGEILAFADSYLQLNDCERATYRTRMLSGFKVRDGGYQVAVEFFRELDSM